METELLSRLKVKPIPKSIKTVEILLNRPDVKEREDVFLKTKVVDKSGQQGVIDREAFLERIQRKVATRAEERIREDKKQGFDSTSKDVGQEVRQDDKSSKREDKPGKKSQSMKDADTSIVLIVDISRTGRKITIGRQNIEVEIDVAPDKSVYRQDRKTVRPADREIIGPESLLEMKDAQHLIERIPKPDAVDSTVLRSSKYYLNNRELFINSINSLFEPYKQQLMEEDADPDNPNRSCDKKTGDFRPLTHQKIVRDYINLYTPYRGLLLYHGLGSGKSCSSIGIAEGLKHDKQVIIMIPASLKANYVSELKKCGDLIYKKTQYWEFIKTTTDAELARTLAGILNVGVDYVVKNGGAWFVDSSKRSNYETLSASQQSSLNQQLDEMIASKYQFIHYNGMRMSHLKAMTQDFTINPFDNRVVIVDEAHNLISRIINKLKRPNSLAMRLYDYLMSAQDCKIVFLSGTPIINYPNEISIMFNMLRGYIYTYYIKLNIQGGSKVDLDAIKEMFQKSNNNVNVNLLYDYIDYKPSTNILTITKNPFNFKNVYNPQSTSKNADGVEFSPSDETGITNQQFLEQVRSVLTKNKIKVEDSGVRLEAHRTLPDSYDDFRKLFMDDKNMIKNHELLKLRIIGLTSHFPDIVELLPKYNKSTDFEVIKIPMSEFQFPIYEKARVEERKLEKRRKKKTDDVYEDSVSTYRIFSRAFCNFVFPTPDIKRPFPNDSDTIESGIQQDAINLEAEDTDVKLQEVFDADELDEEVREKVKQDLDQDQELEQELDKELDQGDLTSVTIRNKKLEYNAKIQKAIAKLTQDKEKYLGRDGLAIYSPKFLNMYENIVDPTHEGLHLVYSQFRTLEGIGVFRLVLMANGFAEFRLKRSVTNDEWTIDIEPSDMAKPKFALYTGTETVEEREIIRNIFNNNFSLVPANIASQVRTMADTNTNGELIKLLMITASGAEGINLKNVRYVHITEPYWHPVRMEQVIGRARRICSHQELEPRLQTVKVFLYLMTFSDAQLKSDDSIELRVNDKSKRDGVTPLTSDESLYEISTIKEDINRDLLRSIKESSIDCNIHVRGENQEGLQCFSIGNPKPDRFAYVPNIANQEEDKVANINKERVTWTANTVKIQGIQYAYRKDTGEVYDLDSYRQKNPILVGNLTITDGKYRFKRI
jgi:hypothetical protein